jgi:hypothetical protein
MMRSAFSRILGVLSVAFDSDVPRQQGELLLYEYRSFFLVFFLCQNWWGRSRAFMSPQEGVEKITDWHERESHPGELGVDKLVS